MRPTEKFDLYALGAAAAGLAVFLFIISKKVFVSGLCCGDDAAMAIVAKNVAWGYGYATSFHHTGAPGLFLFDYGISTGPALILPAAALIGVVGNTSWAPGLTTAVVVGVALLLVWITQVRRTGALPGSVFLLSFLLLCFAFTTRHFEHWHALLGEMPAGLLVVAAGLLIGGNPDDRRTAGFAGLLLALAVLTKLLAGARRAGDDRLVRRPCSTPARRSADSGRGARLPVADCGIRDVEALRTRGKRFCAFLDGAFALFGSAGGIGSVSTGLLMRRRSQTGSACPFTRSF